MYLPEIISDWETNSNILQDAVHGVLRPSKSCHIRCLSHLICCLCMQAKKNLELSEISVSQKLSLLRGEIKEYIEGKVTSGYSPTSNMIVNMKQFTSKYLKKVSFQRLCKSE